MLGIPFSTAAHGASQATAWDTGHRASPRSAHTRPVTPPGLQPCKWRPETGCAPPSGLDRTGQPMGAWPGVTACLPKCSLHVAGCRHISDEWGQRRIPADTRGPSGGPRETRGAASCRGLVPKGKSSQNKMQLPSFTTKEAGLHFSPENQGARHARWPSSHPVCQSLQ